MSYLRSRSLTAAIAVAELAGVGVEERLRQANAYAATRNCYNSISVSEPTRTLPQAHTGFASSYQFFTSVGRPTPPRETGRLPIRSARACMVESPLMPA